MTEVITLGGGCFWCTEAAFQLVRGVTAVDPGYAERAEVVRVTFNPDQVGLCDLLEIFWTIHDPTTPDRQGYDVGPQYRSIILYSSESQLPVIRRSLVQAREIWGDGVVTEVQKLQNFHPAEEYHRNFFRNVPERAYCQIIINPKLEKLRQKFASRLVES